MSGHLVFLVGSRRSGTLWAQRLIGSHARISSIPTETHLFSYGLSQVEERLQHGLRESPRVGSVYAPREAAIGAIGILARTILDPHREPGDEILIERTPHHVHHLELIGEALPGARVIHLIRDGRDVARSLAVQPWGPTTIADAATEWRDSVEAGRAWGSEQGSDRYREVRYEALSADPAGGAASIWEWLGLPGESGDRKAASQESRVTANLGPGGKIAAQRWKQEWGNEELAEFNAVAGELLAELGYDTSLKAEGSGARRRRKRLRGRGKQEPDVAAALPAQADDPATGARQPQAGDGVGPGPWHSPGDRPDRSATAAQQLIEALAEALQHGSVDQLAGFGDEQTIYSISEAGRASEANGMAGAELMVGALSEDRRRSRGQIAGTVRPAIPTTSLAITLDLGDGETALWACAATFSEGRLSELHLNRAYASADEGPDQGSREASGV